jgi:hypothetical protein
MVVILTIYKDIGAPDSGAKMSLTSSRGSIIIEHPSRGVVSSVAGKLQLGLLFPRDTIKK